MYASRTRHGSEDTRQQTRRRTTLFYDTLNEKETEFDFLWVENDFHCAYSDCE